MWLRDRKSEKEGAQEAHAALLDARQNLRRTKSRTPEVREIAGALRVLREHNHFAEKLSYITEGGHKL